MPRERRGDTCCELDYLKVEFTQLPLNIFTLSDDANYPYLMPFSECFRKF
jgi:hypothetical protein